MSLFYILINSAQDCDSKPQSKVRKETIVKLKWMQNFWAKMKHSVKYFQQVSDNDNCAS